MVPEADWLTPLMPHVTHHQPTLSSATSGMGSSRQAQMDNILSQVGTTQPLYFLQQGSSRFCSMTTKSAMLVPSKK